MEDQRRHVKKRRAHVKKSTASKYKAFPVKKKLSLQTLMTTMSQYNIISKRNKICQWHKMHLYSKVWRDKFQWKKDWCTKDLTTTCIQIISIAYCTFKGKNIKNFTKEDTEQLDNKYKNYVTKLTIHCKYTWLLI